MAHKTFAIRIRAPTKACVSYSVHLFGRLRIPVGPGPSKTLISKLTLTHLTSSSSRSNRSGWSINSSSSILYFLFFLHLKTLKKKYIKRKKNYPMRLSLEIEYLRRKSNWQTAKTATIWLVEDKKNRGSSFLVVDIVVVSEIAVLLDVLPDLAGVHPRHKVFHVPGQEKKSWREVKY